MAALGDALAVGGPGRERVAFQHRDPLIRVGQDPRGGQAGHAGAEHHGVVSDLSAHYSHLLG